MTLRWLVAAIHLLALGIGMAAVLDRAWSLRGPLEDTAGLRRVFRADTLWGLAAVLWVSTGLWRAFGGLEKGSAYYLGNHVFWAKMGLLMLVLILEIGPARALIRWRRDKSSGRHIDTSAARRYSLVSMIQAILIALMVLAATAMARGIGQ